MDEDEATWRVGGDSHSGHEHEDPDARGRKQPTPMTRGYNGSLGSWKGCDRPVTKRRPEGSTGGLTDENGWRLPSNPKQPQLPPRPEVHTQHRTTESQAFFQARICPQELLRSPARSKFQHLTGPPLLLTLQTFGFPIAVSYVGGGQPYPCTFLIFYLSGGSRDLPPAKSTLGQSPPIATPVKLCCGGPLAP